MSDETMLVEEEDVLENDTPTSTDNSPRPEDGVQPTDEEIAALLASLKDDEDE